MTAQTGASAPNVYAYISGTVNLTATPTSPQLNTPFAKSVTATRGAQPFAAGDHLIIYASNSGGAGTACTLAPVSGYVEVYQDT